MTRFKAYDHDTLVGIMQVALEAETRCSSGAMTKTAKEELLKGLGFNANPDGLLADSRLGAVLDFADLHRNDWVHDWLQHGVFNKEVDGLLRACKMKEGISTADFRSLMSANWKFPKYRDVKASNLQRLFYGGNESEDKKFKGKATELLSLSALLRHFCERTIGGNPRVAKERKSFEAACDVLDLLMEAKRSACTRMEQLVPDLIAAQCTHMALHQIAYGVGLIIPKHHAQLHVGSQFARDGMGIDMLVLERLNLRLKRVTEPVCNKSKFESTILASVLTKHHNQLMEAPNLLPGLRGRSSTLDGNPDVRIAGCIAADGRVMYVGDVIFAGDVVGIIVACGCEGGKTLFLIVQMFEAVGPRWRSSCTYAPTDELRVTLLSGAREASAWYVDCNGRYVILH